MKRRTIIWGIALLVILSLCLYFFYFSFEADDWTTNIQEIGSASSPRVVDLNQDGVLDLVIGGGGPEFKHTNFGVVALDGKDGSILWNIEARNQIVGSAIFKDITADGTPDVFIGGRSATLFAIDGRLGEKIWEYRPDVPDMDLLNDTSYLAFFNPQFIPDVDGDGMEDLLTANGGYIRAPPEQIDRPKGSLMVISSQNGSLLKRMYMPDGRETYMSPLVHDFEGTGSPSVIFGSGGESINGHLYAISLQAFLNEDFSAVETLADGRGKGFIAPPVLADVDLDGIQDLVVNAVDGRMICLDGRTKEVKWTFSPDSGYEVYTMPAPGFFVNDDQVPDFYTSLGHGPWPNTDFTLHLLIDGSTGKPVFSDTLGLFQYASPLAYDFDGDHIDDVLLVVNELKTLRQREDNIKYYFNDLVILAGKDHFFHQLGNPRFGSNMGSTPLITDLDGDGWVDIIHCYMSDGKNFYSFQNSKIERRELKVSIRDKISWGSYMGPRHDGVFSPASSY